MVWIEESFFDGGGLEAVSSVLTCLLWNCKNCLARTRRGIALWKKISPAHSRGPLPRSFVALIVDQLVKDKHPRVAIGVWMALGLFLRPEEVLGVLFDDAILAAKATG